MRRRSGFTLLEVIASLAMLTFIASVLFSGMLSANRYQVQLATEALSLHAIDNTLERVDTRAPVSLARLEKVLSHELSAAGLDDRVQGRVRAHGGRVRLEVVFQEKKVLASVEVGL